MKSLKFQAPVLLLLVVMQIIACAQPVDERFNISFYLGDNMQQGYTLCEEGLGQRVTDSILSSSNFIAANPTINISDPI